MKSVRRLAGDGIILLLGRKTLGRYPLLPSRDGGKEKDEQQGPGVGHEERGGDGRADKAVFGGGVADRIEPERTDDMPGQHIEDRTGRAAQQVGGAFGSYAEALGEGLDEGRTQQDFRRDVGGNGDGDQHRGGDDRDLGLTGRLDEGLLHPVDDIFHDAAFHDELDHAKDEEDEDDDTSVEVKPEENGTIKVDKITDKDGNNKINISKPSDEAIVEITDIESIKNGTGSIEITNGNQTLLIPFSVFDKELLVDGSSVIVKLKKSNDDTITKGLKAVNKVYEIDLSIKNRDKSTKITTAKDGRITMSITLTDDELKGLNKSKLSAFYYNEENKKYEIVETKVDGNTIVFTTDKIGKFIIAEKSSTVDGSILPQTGGTNNMYYIIIALLCTVGGIAIVYKKKELRK